jgi:hypothetical protein
LKTVHKTLLSFLITIFLFVLFVVFASNKLFKIIELNFYEPTVIKSIENHLDKIHLAYEEYYNDLNSKFSSFVGDELSLTFLEREVEEEKLKARADKIGVLEIEVAGLNGIRLIEGDGSRIHFSTIKSDILRETDVLIAYRNYTELNDLEYSKIAAEQIGEDLKIDLLSLCKIIFNEKTNEIIFSYPLYDEMKAFRGTFAFYVRIDDFINYLSSKDIVSFSSRVNIVEPNGFIFELPNVGRKFLITQIQDKWNYGFFGAQQIAYSEDKNLNYFMISKNYDSKVLLGWICKESDFSFSDMEKLILLLCFFIIVLLTVSLAFNVKADDMIVIKNRIKKIQYEFLKEYVNRKDDDSWKLVSKDLLNRKYDLTDEIKSSLGKKGKKYVKELDVLIDKTWTDMISSLSGGMIHSDKDEKIEIKEEEQVEELEEIESLEPYSNDDSTVELEEVEELEELEEIEDVGEVEEIEELEEIEVIEELEELQENESELINEKTEEVKITEFVPNAEIIEEKEQPEEIEIIESSQREFQEQEEKGLNLLNENAEIIKRAAAEQFNISSLDFSSLDSNSEDENQKRDDN